MSGQAQVPKLGDRVTVRGYEGVVTGGTVTESTLHPNGHVALDVEQDDGHVTTVMASDVITPGSPDAPTERRYTLPEEHTLYPKPTRRYECAECGASGYFYPDANEVCCYSPCIRLERVHAGTGHVWVYPGTIATQGTGTYVFPGLVPALIKD